MAQEDIARLVAVLEANISSFTKNMERAKQVADREFGTIERRMRTTERSFSDFGRSGINALISRYFSIAAAIRATQVIVRESIENNDEASKSWQRLDAAMSSIGESSGPAVSAVLNLASAVIEELASEIESLNKDWDRLKHSFEGGINVPMGVSPLQPGYNKQATFEKKTGNYIPAPGGFAVPGVTDITPGVDKELKAALDYGEQLADMARRMQSDRIESEEATQKKLLEDALDYGDQLLDQVRETAARRIDAEEETQRRLLEDALQYGDQLNEETRKLSADRIAAQLEMQKQRIEEIGDAFEYLGRAAFEGGQAFQRAIANMLQSLALSGLRSLFESVLKGLAGGGGFLGTLISGRASGGPVYSGSPYIVGEKGPELFVPKQSGSIIPQLPTANAVAGSRPMSVDLRQTIDLTGANGDATIAAIARQAAQQGTLIAVSTIRKQFPQLMIKAQRDSL